LALTVERRLCVGAGLPRLGERDQPRRRQSCGLRTTRLPLIHSASGVPARRPDDVTAGSARIDAGPDLADAIADVDTGIPNPNQMPATAGSDGRPGRWQRTALGNQLIERGLAIDLPDRIDIKIDDPHSARGSCWHPDHGVGVLLPPSKDLCFVLGRVLEAVGGERLLVDWIARKDWDAAADIIERGLEDGRRTSLRLGHRSYLRA